MVISVDTGNKMIKTEHYEFNSGIDVLDTAFRNWCMQRAEEKLEIPTYTNCTICFVHVYDETLPLQMHGTVSQRLKTGS